MKVCIWVFICYRLSLPACSSNAFYWHNFLLKSSKFIVVPFLITQFKIYCGTISYYTVEYLLWCHFLLHSSIFIVVPFLITQFNIYWGAISYYTVQYLLWCHFLLHSSKFIVVPFLITQFKIYYGTTYIINICTSTWHT